MISIQIKFKNIFLECSTKVTYQNGCHPPPLIRGKVYPTLTHMSERKGGIQICRVIESKIDADIVHIQPLYLSSIKYP